MTLPLIYLPLLSFCDQMIQLIKYSPFYPLSLTTSFVCWNVVSLYFLLWMSQVRGRFARKKPFFSTPISRMVEHDRPIKPSRRPNSQNLLRVVAIQIERKPVEEKNGQMLCFEFVIWCSKLRSKRDASWRGLGTTHLKPSL